MRRHSEIVGEALNGKIYLDMESGGVHNEEEKCHGLAQSNALDGFLYRTLRRNWLFDTGGDIIT
jgi:hypothetical protein